VISYSYEIGGTSHAGAQTWEHKGIVQMEREGDFAKVPNVVIADAFWALTNGQATYGKPGLSCSGPYSITRLVIERVDAKH
jgi:hypothetical protein